MGRAAEKECVDALGASYVMRGVERLRVFQHGYDGRIGIASIKVRAEPQASIAAGPG